MAKYCPILERSVVYLDCLECDEKSCEKKINTEEQNRENNTINYQKH